MSRTFTAVLVLTVLAASCAPLEAPPLVRSPDPLALIAPDPPDAPQNQGARSGPTLVFEGLSPQEAKRANVGFALPADALGRCVPESNGLIRIRVESRADHTQLSVQPGTNLDPLQRRCVLETLSTLNMGGLDIHGVPTGSTEGFTQLLRIEW